jgi:hypothetical protein
MSEAISAFCWIFGFDDVPSGSSPQSRLQALGDHARGRLRGALHHSVRRAFVVLASHYDVDLERVSEGYCLPDEDEAALAEVQRLDAAAAGPSAVLATTFEAEILPPAPSSEAGADLAEGGDEAEGAAPSPGDGRRLILPEQFSLNACVSFAAVEAQTLHYRNIRLCFFSFRFAYPDPFVSSRLSRPSKSHFSW